MADYTLLILYCSLALGVSFLCSILEAVTLSIPQTYVVSLEKNASKSGKLWSKLKGDDAVGPLTAILTLNTIAHTMGAAGVGSQIQTIYGEEMLTFGSIILTIAVLFLSEIIPKTLGSAYWKQLALPSAYVLLWLTRVMFILIAPIQIMKSLFPEGKKNTVTRDDVAAIADIGEEEGILDPDEERVIHNLLQLRDIKVETIMTPRVVVYGFEIDSNVKDVLEENSIIRFSRIPVYNESLDDIQGIVIRSEVLMSAGRGEWENTMTDLMKPHLTVQLDSTAEDVLDLFLEEKQQFAIVQDEFGGTSGIVTMEDVIETLLGKEIMDELDEVEDMRELARTTVANGLIDKSSEE
ncbi:MAG: CNNM domain-containing protein [archaeon]|nr:CNNM domain-containing protein [archaeon]MDA1167961.1 CNNM domain-containing protein [archaeon]